MDPIDQLIIEILQEDSRTSVTEISRRVNLSRPSVNERLMKMTEKGIIEGFTARVPPEKIGYEVSFIMEISELSISWKQMESMLLEIPYITEYHRVTGNSNYFAKASVPDIETMNELLSRLMKHCHVSSSIILHSPLINRPLKPL